MSVFVDTGVFYAHHDVDASRHDSALQALNLLLQSTEYGQVVTSDYVYDEVVTLTQRRTGDPEPARTIGRRIRGVDPFPSVYKMAFLDSATFDRAVELFERFDDQSLSFTDATIIAVCERNDIDRTLSFDSDFDGLWDRLNPEDTSVA